MQLSRVEAVREIDTLQEQMLSCDGAMNASEFITNNFITANGLFAREMILPAGLITVGLVKKEEYISVLSAGTITEITPDGRTVMQAPYTWVSKGGEKRVVAVHETSVLVTFHKTKETNMLDIANSIVEMPDSVVSYITGGV